MAAFVIANALIFHENISGTHNIDGDDHVIPSLAHLLSRGNNNIVRQDIVQTWNDILNINYVPVFKIALDIIQSINLGCYRNIMNILETRIQRIIELQTTHSSDIYGELFQKVISDRKNLASYYTKPESASLIASLITILNDTSSFTDDQLRNYKIADFACGTGILLNAVYKKIILQCSIRINMNQIHSELLEKNVIGLDVLPIATHLTVSTLINIFPQQFVNNTRIHTMPIGPQEMAVGDYRLGSLDLIDDDNTTLFSSSTRITGKGEKKEKHHEIEDNSCNLIIMNPPFVRSTNHSGEHGDGNPAFKMFNIPINDQLSMGKLANKKFKDTCAHGNAGLGSFFMAIADKKLAYNGIVSLILPATMTSGESWLKLRNLLLHEYKNLIIISIANSKDPDPSFSSDTSMAEIILVAIKQNKSHIQEYKNLKDNIIKINQKLQRLEKGLVKTNERKKTFKTDMRKKKDKKESEKILARKIQECKLKIKLANKELNQKQVIINNYSEPRGKFISLYKRPTSILEGILIAEQIKKINEFRRLENERYGGSPLCIGNKIVGNGLDCPLHTFWPYVNVVDPSLIQFIYGLTTNVLRINNKKYSIPICFLKKVASIGPHAFDIKGYVDNKIRGPFNIHNISGNPQYPAIWNNNHETQKSLIISPDKMCIPKKNATNEHIDRVWSTSAHSHININTSFISQALSISYTNKITIGGRSWPSVIFNNRQYEKAFSVWGNSLFGMMCYWYISGKQQFGRGLSSRTDVLLLPILDFEKLSKEQILSCDELFDKYSDKKLEPISKLYKDNIRKRFDEGILEILNIDISESTLDDLRKRFCLEPSISGGKPNSDLFEKNYKIRLF